MQRVLFATAFFSCIIQSAVAGGQPIKDAPRVLHLASGNEVTVLSITRTTLHGSDEPALALQYVTDVSVSDTEKLYSEAEQVFDAIRPIAEQQKLHAAVVTANEPASSLISMPRGAGWCWKQRADGSWHEPDAGDMARVPK